LNLDRMKKLPKKYVAGFVFVVLNLMLLLSKMGYVSTTIAVSMFTVVLIAGVVTIYSSGRMWIECTKCKFREEVKNDPRLHITGAKACPVCGGKCIVVDDYIAGG